MTPLIELAEKCEAATGADRKLDAAICREVDLPQCVYPDCAPDVLEQIIERTESGEWDQDPECPFYTSSIDSAMTLVPEGWFPKLWKEAPEYWRAHLGFCNRALGQNGKAATPALALCAASLRARAAQQ